MPKDKSKAEKGKKKIVGLFDPSDNNYFKYVGQVYAKYCVDNIADVAKTLAYPNDLGHDLEVQLPFDKNYKKFFQNYHDGLSFRKFFKVMFVQSARGRGTKVEDIDYHTIITTAHKYRKSENLGLFKDVILGDCFKESVQALEKTNTVNNIIVTKLKINLFESALLKGTEIYAAPEDSDDFWERYKTRLQNLFNSGTKRFIFVCARGSPTFARLRREMPKLPLEDLQYS